MSARARKGVHVVVPIGHIGHFVVETGCVLRGMQKRCVRHEGARARLVGWLGKSVLTMLVLATTENRHWIRLGTSLRDWVSDRRIRGS